MNVSRKPSRRRARRGAQAIEFALVMPLFLAIISGVMDYAFYFTRDASFRHVVHLAARAAAATSFQSDPEAAFTSALSSGLAEAGFTGSVSATATLVGAEGDRFLEIEASLPWDGLIGLTPQPSVLAVRSRPRLEDQEYYD